MDYKIINRKKLIAVKTVDNLFRPIVRGWQRLLGKRPQPLLPQDFLKIKKILILRTAYTGDVVMTLPVLQPLRAVFPNAQISVLASHSAAPILEHHPALDRVVKYDAFWFYPQAILAAFNKYQEIIHRLRQEQFDLAIDFRGDLRDIFLLAYRSKAKYRISYGSGGGEYWLTQVVPLREIKHRVQFHLDILRELNIPIVEDTPQIYLTAVEKQNTLSRLQQMKLNPEQDNIIGIHQGARMPLKRWASDRYKELITRILETKLGKVILFVAPNDNIGIENFQPLCQTGRFYIISQLSLRELAALLVYCRVLVCNDSAPMHIATAVGTKCIAIFGPSKSNETRPYGTEHITIEKPYSCRPTCDETTCHYRIYNDCLKTITVDEVFQAVEIQMLKEMTAKVPRS